MAENLFVCDVDYDVMACKIQDYWEAEDEILERLLDVLTNVLEHGIASGDAHNSIEILKEAIELIYANSNGQGAEINKITLDFLNRIDEIDLKLYGG